MAKYYVEVSILGETEVEGRAKYSVVFYYIEQNSEIIYCHGCPIATCATPGTWPFRGAVIGQHNLLLELIIIML